MYKQTLNQRLHPDQYDKGSAWFEQHPYFYARLAVHTLVGAVLFGLMVWGLGRAFDYQIDENNRRSCDMAYRMESVTHPVVRNCLEYYQTGNVEYLR